MGASWPTVLLLFSVFAALHGYSLKPFGEPAEKKSNLVGSFHFIYLELGEI